MESSQIAVDSRPFFDFLLHQEVIKKLPNLPHTAIVWSNIYPGLEVPLQAIRYCYSINHVTEDDIYMALTLPAFTAKGTVPWEYHQESDSILTKDKVLAACLNQRGRTVTFKIFTVGLVYSEVLEALEHRSAKSLQLFQKLLEEGAYFSFKDCGIEQGLKAISKSSENGMIACQDGVLTCKSFRIALEIVNNTGYIPKLMIKNEAILA